MKKILVLVAMAFIAISAVQAQHKDTHDHPQSEIGLDVSGVYEIEHGEWTPGFHVHYFRSFTPHSRWAWGGGPVVGYAWAKDHAHVSAEIHAAFAF